MSVSQPKYKPMNDIMITTDSCKTPISLANLVDNVNNNNLHVFYPKEDSLFKKKIDKLNLKFYLETEKYLSNQHNERKCQEALFIILFQQISLYIEEIERLNLLIQEKKGDPKYIKERVDEYIRKQKNFETKELLIKTLKESKVKTEQRLAEMMTINDKIKSENESLKRQNQFYQEKLKLYLQNQLDSNNSQITDASSLKMTKNFNSNESLQLQLQLQQQQMPMQQGQQILQLPQTVDGGFNLNQSIKLSKIVNKKRNYSDNNPSNQNVKFQNDMNVGGRGINRYAYNNNMTNANNIIESNNGNKTNMTSNGAINNSNSSSNNKQIKKKEFKIIKAVKEQLSGEIKNKSDVIQSSRCKSPFYSKEEYTSVMNKFDTELNDLNTMELFLKEFKRELLQENSNSFDNCIGIDYESLLGNNQVNSNSINPNQGNEHIKTEVMVSDLEDYEGKRPSPLLITTQEVKKPPIANNKTVIKQYPLFNSVTIDLNSSSVNGKEKEKEYKENSVNNYNSNNNTNNTSVSSNGKIKIISTNFRQLTSSTQKKKGI